MEFTKEEVEELRLILLERAKAKAIADLQERARVERTALVEQVNAERNRIMVAVAPIDAKLRDDIAVIESVKAVEDLK